MSGERNMYGCTPCPKCGGVHRYPFTEKGRKVIACDDCGRRGPWDGTWSEDGCSVDETPDPLDLCWCGHLRCTHPDGGPCQEPVSNHTCSCRAFDAAPAPEDDDA